MWPAALACAALAALLWPAKGKLLVESNDPDVELVFRGDGAGAGARTSARTREREIELRPGTYTAELADPRPGLRLSPGRFEIVGKGQARVRVLRVPEPGSPNAGAHRRRPTPTAARPSTCSPSAPSRRTAWTGSSELR